MEVLVIFVGGVLAMTLPGLLYRWYVQRLGLRVDVLEDMHELGAKKDFWEKQSEPQPGDAEPVRVYR